MRKSGKVFMGFALLAILIIGLSFVSAGMFGDFHDFWDKIAGKITGKSKGGITGGAVSGTTNQFELFRDTNFEVGIHSIIQTKSRTCDMPGLSYTPLPWQTNEVATHTYFCDNLPNPKSLSPNILYESKYGWRKFYSDKNGGIKIIFDTSKEENNGCDISWENNPTYWPHYYIDHIFDWIDLNDFSELRYNVDVKLNDANMINDCDKGADQARFGIVFLLTNKFGSGTGGTPWFWLMIMSCNTDDLNTEGCDSWSKQIAKDQYGIAIYHQATSTKYPKLQGGQWVNYNFDVKQFAQEAINYYNSKYNPDIKLSDFYLTSHEIGWEIWGDIMLMPI